MLYFCHSKDYKCFKENKLVLRFKMKKILVIEPLLEEVIELFQKKQLYKIDYMPEISESELSSKLCSYKYDALIVRNKNITENIIESWAKVKLGAQLAIVRAGSNISTIDIAAASKYGIAVMNTPGANSQAVAQHIITQLIVLSGNVKQTLAANDDVKADIIKDKHLYRSCTLAGNIISIIGTGAIGSKVARIASSLGMTVKAYSPNFNREKADKIGAIYCKSMEEVVRDAHFISVQVPFTMEDKDEYPKTFDMINKRLLDNLTQGVKLINVSRSLVINPKALSQAIKEERVAGASLDLLSSEIEQLKHISPDLIANQNVIITPLIACESYSADKEIAQQAFLKITSFLDGTLDTKHVINFSSLNNTKF